MSNPDTLKNQQQPRQEKLQQQVEELCGSTIRAFSGEAKFQFRGRRPEINGKSSGIRAPHLQADLNKDDFRSFRGAADGIALRLKHSDIDLHRDLMPDTAVGQLIFELLEQLRVESLVDPSHPGIKKNVDHRYKAWCAQFCASNMTENHVGLLVYTIAQVVWSRLSGQPVNESTEGLIEPNRMMLAPHIGTYLVGMKRNASNQHIFAENALGVVQVIDELVNQLDDGDDDDDKKASKAEEVVSSFGLILYPEGDAEGELSNSLGRTTRSEYRELLAQLQSYKVYSKDNDRIIDAEKLVPLFLRKKLRAQLDERIRGQGVNVHRLARELAMILSAPERDGWNFGEEEGYLDARRLSRLVTSPDYRQLFQKERYQLKSNCLVTFLMDNSGSMKEHIGSIATLIELMTRALERAGVSTEILGFTTRCWQGGKTYKDWRSRDRNSNPGRLTELEHIIYKDADTPIKKARQNIAAMLKPDLFREGIDGEALLWAAERMAGRTEERRILIVLSDGCPMETATSQNNEPDFLDNHLRQVASMLEARGDIELYALGFGLDLSTYYRNNLALDLPEVLENSVFKEILNMLRKGR
ncbi:MAG: cobalamin biosynthesis protein CobT [Motiliproteus sp.]